MNKGHGKGIPWERALPTTERKTDDGESTTSTWGTSERESYNKHVDQVFNNTGRRKHERGLQAGQQDSRE